MPRPSLRTIRNVELVKVGVHEISTGTWTVTPDDLRSAVEAARAGVIRARSSKPATPTPGSTDRQP